MPQLPAINNKRVEQESWRKMWCAQFPDIEMCRPTESEPAPEPVSVTPEVTPGILQQVAEQVRAGLPLEDLRGPIGPIGPQGPAGERGIMGDAGRDGKDGRDGTDGKDGQDGAPGRDGEIITRFEKPPVSTIQQVVQEMLGDQQSVTGGNVNLKEEVPSGAINSSNTTFTLAETPTTLLLFLNGQLMSEGVNEDYTLSGSTITMLDAPKGAPGNPDKLSAVYT